MDNHTCPNMEFTGIINTSLRITRATIIVHISSFYNPVWCYELEMVKSKIFRSRNISLGIQKSLSLNKVFKTQQPYIWKNLACVIFPLI